VLVYVVGGVPLLYIALDHLANPPIDANIGLGITFMYTWLFSAVTFLLFLLKVVRKRRQK
jgi:hypothetical protein